MAADFLNKKEVIFPVHYRLFKKKCFEIQSKLIDADFKTLYYNRPYCYLSSPATATAFSTTSPVTTAASATFSGAT